MESLKRTYNRSDKKDTASIEEFEVLDFFAVEVDSRDVLTVMERENYGAWCTETFFSERSTFFSFGLSDQKAFARSGFFFIIPSGKGIDAYVTGKYPQGVNGIFKVFRSSNGKLVIESPCIFIKFDSDTSVLRFNSAIGEYGKIASRYLGVSPHLFAYEIPHHMDTALLVGHFKSYSGIEYIEPDYLFCHKLNYRPDLGDNPAYINQWHLDNSGVDLNDTNPGSSFVTKIGADINAEAAWDLLPAVSGVPQAGIGIKIAFGEYGFNVQHPDLISAIELTTTHGAARFRNFQNAEIGRNNIGDDFDGGVSHGTGTIGMAVARLNAHHGTVGIAYDATCIPLEVGRGSLIHYGRLIAYAADPAKEINGGDYAGGADILSFSTGPHKGLRKKQFIADAIMFATTYGRNGRGLVILNAVDNDFIPITIPSDPVDFFSGFNEVIGIGSCGPDDRYYGSAFGANEMEIDFVAPGVNIYTTDAYGSNAYGKSQPYPDAAAVEDNTVPVGYIKNVDGTSYSAPLSAGIAALMLQVNPKLSWIEVRELLRRSCVVIDPAYYGKLCPFFDDTNGPVDMGWKTDVPGGTPMDVVNIRGQLIIDPSHPASSRTLLDDTVQGDNPLEHGTSDITIDGGTADFLVGQAVLIGAQTYLTADVSVPGTVNTSFILDVYDATPFAGMEGKYLRVGLNISTFLPYDSNAADDDILPVVDPSGFKPGDRIRVIDDVFTIDEIRNDLDDAGITDHQYPFFYCTTNRSSGQRYGKGDLITLADTCLVLIDTVDTVGNTITVKTISDQTYPSAYLEQTPVELQECEVKVIRSILGDGVTLRIDSLIGTHDAGTPVFGGYIPKFSRAYGFGRIDAKRAVQNAIAYTFEVDNPDLVVRDELSDDGLSTTTTAIDSPDIWITHDDHPVSDFDSLDYLSDTGPHVNPDSDRDRFIYVRVANIGGAPNYEAKINVYIALSPTAATPDFDFPVGWKDAKSIKSIISGDVGFYKFDPSDFTEAGCDALNPDSGKNVLCSGELAAAVPLSSIFPNKVFKIKWPKTLIPPSGADVQMHVLLHVSPFDGQKSGLQVADNNNLTYKAIQLVRRVLFHESLIGSVSTPLLVEAPMSQYAQAVTQNFVIEVVDADGFLPGDIVIGFVRKKKGGFRETVLLSYSAGTWNFDGDAPDWILMTQTPVVGPGTETSVRFDGQIDLEPGYRYFKIEAGVTDTTIFDSHKIKVKITDFDPEQGNGEKGGPRMHFYTTLNDSNAPLATQTDDDVYGAYQDGSDPNSDFFRLCNLHKTTSGHPKAFAVCDGTVCVQKVSATQVNIILKPNEQPAVNIPPVKYFIYRGIRTSSLFNGTEIAVAATNKLTQSIWDSNQNRYASINAKRAELNQSAVTIENPSEKSLGIHLDATLDAVLYGDDASIDNLFFKGDVDYVLPVVQGGWDIGDFDGTGFGFEIVLDSGLHYTPKLSITRTITHTVNVDKLIGSEDNDVRVENRLQRQEILHYMDASAFFGQLYGNRLFTRDTPLIPNDDVFAQKRRDAIYNDVLAGIYKYPNRVYIDIRNEHGHYFNLYENYGDEINIAFVADDEPSVMDVYAEGWPILVVDSSNFQDGNVTNKNTVDIYLPTVSKVSLGDPENPFPLAYLSAGYLKDGFLLDVHDQNKFILLSPSLENGVLQNKFTKEQVALAIPNDSSANATKVVSSYIRINYYRRFDPEGITTPASSSGLVLRGVDYLDHVFAPAKMTLPYGGAEKIQSAVYNSEIYADPTLTLGFDAVFKSGIGIDNNDNVTLFAFTTDMNSTSRPKRNRMAISGQVKDVEGDYLRLLLEKYNYLEMYTGVLVISTVNIQYLELNVPPPPNSDVSFSFIDPRELLITMVTKAQFEDILAIATDPGSFSDKFNVYLGIANKIHGADDNDQPYTSYDLVLRGHQLIGSDYVAVEVAVTPTITVYSYGHI